MAHLSIVSLVDQNWGRGMVYGNVKEPSMQKIIDSKPQKGPRSKTSIELDEYHTYTEADNEEEQNVIDYYGLSYLEATLFATILEETIMETRILVQCNNDLRVKKTHVDMTFLIAIKYEIQLPETKNEFKGIDPIFLGNNDYKLNKLYADRKYFKEVIVTVYKEMTLYKTFDTLQKYVKYIVNAENERMALCEAEAKNRVLRRDFNKQLRQQRNHIKSVVYDADSKIDSLKSTLEDSSLKSEINSRYVENWQCARTEQHLQSIANKEARPSSVIEYYKQTTDYEQRVHSEVELLTNIAINETLEKVDHWMNKYDKDMEDLDLKIQIKKNDYLNMLEARIDLENTIEKHDVMMKEWIHFKEEREKARLYQETMTKSAIIVQAWWRGLLVRCQLGPFKVVKKKGGAAAGKKK